VCVCTKLHEYVKNIHEYTHKLNTENIIVYKHHTIIKLIINTCSCTNNPLHLKSSIENCKIVLKY
jgi:hypothetical protein